jgi:hypothetical protein
MPDQPPPPFSLSLSKGPCILSLLKEGFDKLSPNGAGRVTGR